MKCPGFFKKMTNNALLSSINSTHFEMNGNREVMVEGCKKIVTYEPKIVKIRVKNMVVCFSGRNLNMRCLTPDSLIISGFIAKIEFF